jgi:glyoxylase-like metal-dependent hydrolase (beta-lactamase superfamily II)
MTEYEIYALKYAGPFKSSGAFLMWFKEWERVVERNYYIWCLKGNNETVVVDAGVAPGLAADKNLAGYKNPADVLARMDVSADEVRHVVLSHLHWDHASGVTLFPEATFYIQNEEYRFWMKDPIAARPPFKHVSDERSKAYLSLDGDREILPGLECLFAPGHTVALQALAIHTKAGTAILGSDCGHIFRNYKEDWPSALIVDLVGWMKTYDKLRSKASSIDLIFPGHDPIMTSDYPKVKEDITQLV